MSLNNDKPKTTEEFIKKQIKEEGIKDLDSLKPIDHGTLAKPHTAVYKMHRYFARRPFSVFNELIKHYSNPGSIILDPFCGGGVTVVEALRLRRKVIGVDLNPMATFITKMEVIDVDLNELEKAFKEIEKNVKDEINKMYLTTCSRCKKETPIKSIIRSYVVECTKCKNKAAISELKKTKNGIYQCKKCKYPFSSSKSKKIGFIPVKIEGNCIFCKKEIEKEATDYDIKKAQFYQNKFEEIIKKKKLWHPKIKIKDILKNWKPEMNRILKKDIQCYHQLFSERNLIALCTIFKEIDKIKNKEIKELMLFLFTEVLCWTSKMSNDAGHGWQHHGYWLPDTPYENNVWHMFNKNFIAGNSSLMKGKRYSHSEINGFYKEAKNFEELVRKDKTCLIINCSSTNISLPDKSIDIIITDPPYGGNVNYIDLSKFWHVWLNGEINRKEEAIVNKHERKTNQIYRNLMFKIFKECYRILKPNRWMVMTFHNKDFAVWNALHLAAHDAGFILSEEDGMIYQPPIQNYTQTLHTRTSGSMLGDFVLSFQKAEKKPAIKMIEEIEIGNKVRKIAGETIEYHGGAKLSTIYMRLVPFLLNNGLLHKFGEKDITPFLKKDFVEKEGKWYFKENIDENGEVKPIEYVPVEARIEYLIRSLLYERKQATMDDILSAIFSNLINGNAAEYEEISRVLNRIAEKKDDRNWQLKEIGSQAQQQILQFIEKREKPKIAQPHITGEKLTTEESIHDLMIKQLVALGEDEGYSSHIGQTEQRKYVEFRKMSIPMGNNVQYGLNRQAFDIIREIDLLWLKGDTIVAAFEIEKSTTIDSGINRFRNLFAATPNQNISAYIVIPDNREKETKNKIGSLANRKDNLHKKIKYLMFSGIKIKKGIKVEEKAKEVV
ncbi:MAG: hypothetical protein HZB65_04240 [Candidatus Aenigmarchaeota archaeon]|nr:hypothetical protein [Candidatus Aenigmarchaeota archaeon]